MKNSGDETGIDPWGVLRFAVIGKLWVSPPEYGQLGEEIRRLSDQKWQHPTRDEKVQFGASTIERWYYQTRGTDDPIAALSRQPRSDLGQSRIMNALLLAALKQQYELYPGWSYKLHSDNLAALAATRPELGHAPSYSTVRRVMQQHGWLRKRSLPRNATPGRRAAMERLDNREVRGYEMSHANALWHLDFHQGHRKVVDKHGQWHKPYLLCVLDDYTRLCCHIQWYVSERAETLIHGLTQAFYKRGLPRALMTDNGSAMLANETRNGLLRLGVVHETTLPYSPYQNGKQESFWVQIEGRMMAMLKRLDPLRLDELNRITQAYAEVEYNRRIHSELGVSPIQRLVDGPNVFREAPDPEAVRLAFSVQQERTQRRSDGTVSIQTVRFEVPSRLRTLHRVTVRYQSWDLSTAFIVDPRNGHILACIKPLDKRRNADGRRRTLEANQAVPCPEETRVNADPIPPLLRQCLSEYASTGLPPAYLPLDEHRPGLIADNGEAIEKGDNDA